MNKKLKDRLIIAGCAVIGVIAIVLYTLFAATRLFNEGLIGDFAAGDKVKRVCAVTKEANVNVMAGMPLSAEGSNAWTIVTVIVAVIVVIAVAVVAWLLHIGNKRRLGEK
ncbi:MAG: hypothetical protein K2N18_02645, partial [Clostridia bacterium]|nr:hypothetical protein [Clostridia bacterium]